METKRELLGISAEKKSYDPAKVETLKEVLLKALKHAANIRALKAGDTVAVVVSGSWDETPSLFVRGPGGVFSLSGKPLEASSRQTALTIRVEKSDVDAFAAGTIPFDTFRQWAVMFVY